MVQVKLDELDISENNEMLENPSNSTNAVNIKMETFELISLDGLRLNAHCWSGTSAPDKVVVAVHGMGGHSDYYTDSLAPYLIPAGAVLYAPDLRGHGHSAGTRGDLVSFESFQYDVEAAVRHARLHHPTLPLFMLGESMGTSIAIVYSACAPQDARPDGLVLAACVVAPTLKPRVDEIERTLWYLLRDRQKVVLPTTGREAEGVRDTAFIQVLKSDLLFNRFISVRFLLAMTANMKRAAKLAPQLTLPVLLLQGGRDITVRHRATHAFFNHIASPNKEMHVFPEAYHAILNDPDAPLVRRYIIEWLARQTISFKSDV